MAKIEHTHHIRATANNNTNINFSGYMDTSSTISCRPLMRSMQEHLFEALHVPVFQDHASVAGTNIYGPPGHLLHAVTSHRALTKHYKLL